MIVKGKKNAFYAEAEYDDVADYYIVRVFSDYGNIMGRISFKIEDDETWIYSINAYDEYQHMGVGQALLDACEYISCKNGVRRIRGKYFPSNEYAKPFYEKNDYIITKEYYDTFIVKFINPSITFECLNDKIIYDELESML